MVAVLVGKRDTQLDDLEQVHVALHLVIIELDHVVERAHRSGHHTGELGVLRKASGKVGGGGEGKMH